MSNLNKDKLKKTLNAIPPGFIVDSAWLERHQISRFLARKYVDSGWLERIARGVFRRPFSHSSQPATLDWKIAVLSLQHIMEYQIHVGGSTALALQGYGHYLPLGGNAPVFLYGTDIPNWLTKLPLDAQLETRKTSLFNKTAVGLTGGGGDNTRASLPFDWALTISTPERAIIEALNQLPKHETFHTLDVIFEGLTTLRPRLLSALLMDCKKIKVTRLFFVFADRHSHAWRKRLDPNDFNLGSGDRALIEGGRIHPRYRIMVPQEFAQLNSENNNSA